ncbi:hypothetical protein M9H77_23264 [Catharanthus roseus]|uniref:Uncharacterized protein n=1 Tax=Catharanthus roseus TaxID=4058 RepID=A0ACC0AT79_CATRO|nr:hypothetical protein M9H77_23264 [Catharanthus roseus]
MNKIDKEFLNDAGTVLSAYLFSIGIYELITSQNMVGALMCLELILNTVNINFVTFSDFFDNRQLKGDIFSIFVIAIAVLKQLLDWLLLGIASTILVAPQLVNHMYILVNGRIIGIPSYCCKPRDIIMAKDEQKSRALVQKSLESSPYEDCQVI